MQPPARRLYIDEDLPLPSLSNDKNRVKVEKLQRIVQEEKPRWYVEWSESMGKWEGHKGKSNEEEKDVEKSEEDKDKDSKGAEDDKKD